MKVATAARVLLFAKAPVPGKVKTRLVPALGEEGAARLARRMLEHALAEASASGLSVELVCEPGPAAPEWAGLVPSGVEVTAQCGGDIGARMAEAAERTLARGELAVLIGSDVPGLTATVIARAAAALDENDAAVVPAMDGGYVLLALREFAPELFAGIAWSTDGVLAATLERARALGWRVLVEEALADVDEPPDLKWVPPGWIASLPAQ